MKMFQDVAIKNSQVKESDVPKKVRCFLPSEPADMSHQPIPLRRRVGPPIAENLHDSLPLFGNGQKTLSLPIVKSNVVTSVAQVWSRIETPDKKSVATKLGDRLRGVQGARPRRQQTVAEFPEELLGGERPKLRQAMIDGFTMPLEVESVLVPHRSTGTPSTHRPFEVDTSSR